MSLYFYLEVRGQFQFCVLSMYCNVHMVTTWVDLSVLECSYMYHEQSEITSESKWIPQLVRPCTVPSESLILPGSPPNLHGSGHCPATIKPVYTECRTNNHYPLFKSHIFLLSLFNLNIFHIYTQMKDIQHLKH